MFTMSCKLKSNTESEKGSENKVSETAIDPHTFARPDEAVVKHLDLDIKVNFDTKQISGKASWSINNLAKTDRIIFDTKLMEIQEVTAGKDEKETKFSLGDADPILGKPLTISITAADTLVHIYYTTSKDAGALQWLEPQQTSGKKLPFLFTQSQPILARSWVPAQDGPGIRFTYNATVTVPKELMAVMSAENPQEKNADGIYHFKQTHPIPSYLLALAVGDLTFKPIDERTGVYAEPAMLEKSAWEFAEMGKMVTAAEKIYGPYRWGRYDVLVLPPSFPYGGMENPNLTFATPTIIAGDRSLVALVAHELAHSWSGNLVTNSTWNDMWLNEGFTVYFQHRIMEALYGPDEQKMQEVLSRQDMAAAVKDKGDTSKDTHLKGNYAGRDPDEGSSDIVYDKGFAFLQTIEAAVGRYRFDTFLKKWFNANAFQSRNTEQFLDYLNKELIKGDKSLSDKIMVDAWVYGPGIPKNIPASVSENFNKIDSVIANLRKVPVAGLSKKIKSTNEKLYFLSHLPTDLSADEMAKLDSEFNFTRSGNSEVQAAWYVHAIAHEYKPAYPYIEKFLTEVGRRKFLRPLYKQMIKTPGGKEWAKRIYVKARANYHPVSYTTIDELLK